MNSKVKLIVKGITCDQLRAGAYALILAEDNERERRIPIIVGLPEAQAIAFAYEQVVPPRPLTHDLFTALTKAYEIKLQEVYIYKVEDGIFFAEMTFSKPDGENTVKLDARTSDAVALAMRSHAGIYASSEIIEEYGMDLDVNPSFPKDKSTLHDEELLQMQLNRFQDDELDEELEEELDEELEEELEELEAQNEEKWIRSLNERQLQVQINIAIENEEYELAKALQEELKRRQSEEDILPW